MIGRIYDLCTACMRYGLIMNWLGAAVHFVRKGHNATKMKPVDRSLSAREPRLTVYHSRERWTEPISVLLSRRSCKCPRRFVVLKMTFSHSQGSAVTLRSAVNNSYVEFPEFFVPEIIAICYSAGSSLNYSKRVCLTSVQSEQNLRGPRVICSRRSNGRTDGHGTVIIRLLHTNSCIQTYV